jgi:poly(A) polymerase
MADQATRTVMAALEAAGGEGCARFVGGCVRNAVLGRPIDDIDIATPLEPPAVIRALAQAGLKSVPTGIEHGTVTAIACGKPFEVTTLRRDVATDGRRAVVAFTTDWAEDAQRRDFRLNALYMDAQGGLYDPVGQGLADARAGRIVFVGDAAQRIREDYLRILRFFRFLAWYGRGEPDAEGLAACAALKAGLDQLSAERVSKELLKLLAADDPRPALTLMDQAGVLTAILPGHVGLERVCNLIAIERDAGEAPDPELRLAALLPSDSAVAIREADRLRLSKVQRDRLAAAVAPQGVFGEQDGRGLVYRLGARAVSDRQRLLWAAEGSRVSAQAWAALNGLVTFDPPKFPIAGHEAAQAGFKPGKAMGAALREVEDWWIAQDFQPTREQLIARLKALR